MLRCRRLSSAVGDEHVRGVPDHALHDPPARAGGIDDPAVAGIDPDVTVVVAGEGHQVTGLGLGPVIPSCVAMTVEFAPKARRQLANAVMYSGYSVGGVLAALLGIMLLPHIDWRWLYAFGADFTVIEPVELRAELVAAAEYHDRVAERYRRAVVAQP